MTFVIDKIARSASRYLNHLPRAQQEAIARAFDYLCEVSPIHHPNPTVIKPLKGKYKGLWRYRVGDIRIVYAIDKNRGTIQIVEMDNRGNMYH